MLLVSVHAYHSLPPVIELILHPLLDAVEEQAPLSCLEALLEASQAGVLAGGQAVQPCAYAAPA